MVNVWDAKNRKRCGNLMSLSLQACTGGNLHRLLSCKSSYPLTIMPPCFAQWHLTQCRLFQTPTPYPTSIAALAFSHDGSMLAVASSYTFEQGQPLLCLGRYAAIHALSPACVWLYVV